jgi:hypothetical protein
MGEMVSEFQELLSMLEIFFRKITNNNDAKGIRIRAKSLV